MTIVSLSHEILSESFSARSAVLSQRTNEQAEKALQRAKALILAVWQGTGYATTEQVAEYYEVTDNAVKHLVERNTEEFAQEVRKLTGSDLRDARSLLELPSKTSQALAWTARGMLRVGLMLTQSEVARRVRDVVLNIIEAANHQKAQPQLSLQEAKDFLAEFRAIHDLAKSTGNVRLQQQMETAIAQYTDTFILAGLPNQPLVNGKPIAPINIRYEGCIDVAIRLGFKVPSNYETALGRHAKKLLSHLLVEVDGNEVKDYRTSAASGKRIGAAMYPAFNPEVEKVVSEYCELKDF